MEKKKEKIPGKKKIRKISNALDKIMLIPFLLLFLLGCYSLYDTFYVYDHAQDKSVLQYKPENLEDGEETLSNSVAWITIKNTNIDYPIMQGTTNEEYLNKDPFGNFSLSGSLFLDYRNSSDFSDAYSLVYGHHMEHNTMFGALDDFQKKDYLKKHESGTLTIGNKKKVYKLNVFACGTFQATDNIIFNPGKITSKEILQKINSNNGIVINNKVKTNGKRIVALSTCKDSTDDNRTVVFCTIQEKKKG